RMYSRIQLKTFVSIIKGNFRSNGLIRDISTGGVSIGTVGSYNPGDIVVMTFKLNNNITFRNIKGIVKHIERSMFEAITMGVEFVDFSDERLKELVDFIDAETK
ncbi:MAG: PilZ domain-containing protein, partial [Candidatus Sericytochromatia bacterium]|nr:PilZ domain-containing protein [Candidatus Sericytochromatia bacterium]